MIEAKLSLDHGSCLPGSTLRGEAVWSHEQDLKWVEIRLFWYTEGKGDQDITVVDRIRLEPATRSGGQRFEFTLPESPYSFSGKLISLIWAVEVVLSNGGSGRSSFILSPHAAEISLYA